ncbi:hypothetical protein RD792_013298 [Penstemon davidsonii]|uniref:Glycosyltransferase n=1 Tax=Penstemon davidsonii TaxID=160366 RepID=A0ABR0CT69_9LAMI|nr:hypothetical protein RD792_013298 [Penstemon davidsonii]
MSHRNTAAKLPAHILIFPLPSQGHVNSMLHLAELLSLSGLHVTMVLSEYTHGRLLRHGNLHSRFSRYSRFRIATLADGLPADHPRVGERIMDIVLSLKEVGGSLFRKLMESTDALSDGGTRRRVSCLIMDRVLSFALPVVEEMGIPYVYFRTISACSFWTYFCIQEIIDAGEVPLKAYQEWKDLSGDATFCRVDDINDTGFQTIKTETKRTTTAKALILNTFEDLEGPILDRIRKHIPNLYSIGPLHAHLKARLELKGIESSNHSSSFWEEDRSCMAWLDSQPENSVLYVNFGSVTLLTKDELLEFWYGLVNSGQRFLWVIRPDSIVENDGNEVPIELDEGTKARGYMLEWVPQREVLAHRAIGVFFTHSGWNSTLESICIGIPMLCWAYFADQTTNSRFISEVWKMGFDIKDTCDRILIERMVREIMEVRRNEFLERARFMATMAKKTISEGGDSHSNLDRLIEFLKSTIIS